jgi:hypothetical protein
MGLSKHLGTQGISQAKIRELPMVNRKPLEVSFSANVVHHRLTWMAFSLVWHA